MLLTGVVLIDAVFMGLTGLAVVVLRRKQPEVERAVKVPLYPLVPILFVLGILAVIVGTFMDAASREAALIGVGFIIAATACYFVFFNKKTEPG